MKTTRIVVMKQVLVVGTLLLAASGCTVHLQGERSERQIAAKEGQPFVERPEDRTLPPLSADPTPDELVQYALIASPELEQRYWEWRSAIEQIPQDGTQPTNLVLFAGVPISHGSTAFDRTTVTAANDPMTDIQWPSKPTTAARRALESARAAGLRFEKAKYDLRQKVLNAYYDYALATELLRLQHSETEIVETGAAVAEAAIVSGKSTQTAALKARTEADLLKNEITEQESRLVGLRAALNAAIGRDPAAPLAPRSTLNTRQKVTYTDDEILKLAAERNPELAAIDAEVLSREQGVRLAKLQYVPDLSFSAGTDLAGVAQSLMGMVTVPVLRYEAINAAVAQAEANLRASQTMRRQTANDLQSRVLSDIAVLRNAEHQLSLLNDVIVPRIEQSTEFARFSYEAGHSSVADLLDAQRSLFAVQRLALQLEVTREKQRIDVESVLGKEITSEPAGQS